MRGCGRARAADGGSWGQYARILTAKGFPSMVSTKYASSSSSSSSSYSSVTKANINNGSCGTKRTAESPSSPPGRSAISQVVSWPPVRTYRMNSLANQSKSPVTIDLFSTVDKCKSEDVISGETNHGGNNIANEKRLGKKPLFVKVNMDVIPIGRKVDLNAHSRYKTLARALDDMFRPSLAVGTEHSVWKCLPFLDVVSDLLESGLNKLPSSPS